MSERRHFPRYTCDLELQIQSPQGQYHPVKGNDISEAGISLIVPQSVKTGLANEGISLDIAKKFLLQLPDCKNMAGEKLEIECQIMHVRRLSQEIYLIGAWFNSAEAAELLEKCSLLPVAHNEPED